MNIIIGGSRSYDDFPRLKRVMDALVVNIKGRVTIISAHGDGADRLGERWALEPSSMKKVKELRVFHPYSDKEDHKTRIQRTIEMIDEANAAVIFWDGVSGGAKFLIDRAKKKKLKTKVIRF